MPSIVHDARREGLVGALVSAFCDLWWTTDRYDQWLLLAWSDTVLRYRRTVIGPFWITLSTGITVFAVGLLYGGIFGTDISKYMPFFAAGTIFWTFISSSIGEGCNILINSAGLIKSVANPLPLHIARLLARNFIILIHNLVIMVVAWLVFQWPLDWSVLLAIPGLLLTLIAVLGAVLLLSVLCARYRDVPQIVMAVLQLLFLMTPIIWMPDNISGIRASILVNANPVYYLIEVVRGPLLGRPQQWDMWLIATAISLVAFLGGAIFFGRFKHRVPYWL